MGIRQRIKLLMDDLPFGADIYWQLRGKRKPWSAHYELEDLKAVLPQALADLSASRTRPGVSPAGEPSSTGTASTPPKKVCLFASLHYWIEESALIGLALAGQGHNVNLAYLPYAEWDKDITPFDLRRQDLYTRAVFADARDFLRLSPLADMQSSAESLPAEALRAVEQVSDYDTQYTLQVEETDRGCALYKLRYARNLQAAGALFAWLQAEKPDVLIIPNGTILEMGVAYRVARLLGLRVVTFEFADQRERIWLAQDDEIMSHDTSALWQALGGQSLPEAARRAMLNLYAARRNAKLWGNFARQWQQTRCKAPGKCAKSWVWTGARWLCWQRTFWATASRSGVSASRRRWPSGLWARWLITPGTRKPSLWCACTRVNC